MPHEIPYINFIPQIIPYSNKTSDDFWFIFYKQKLLVKNENNKITIPTYKDLLDNNIKINNEFYLGLFNNISCYTMKVNNELSHAPSFEFMELRSFGLLVDEEMFLLGGRAFQLLNWDETHQYCSKCGNKLELHNSDRAKVCTKCDISYYTKICPSIIVAITKGDEILLAHNNHFPNGLYSLIAGFVEAGETLEEAVKREVLEEVGVRVCNIKYFTSQPWPFPNSLMMAFTAEYLSGDIKADGVEIGHAAWFKADSLPLIPAKISVARKLINAFISNLL